MFKNNYWEIVNDYFWRPKVKEINYVASRKMDTFQFIEYNGSVINSVSAPNFS